MKSDLIKIMKNYYKFKIAMYAKIAQPLCFASKLCNHISNSYINKNKSEIVCYVTSHSTKKKLKDSRESRIMPNLN